MIRFYRCDCGLFERSEMVVGKWFIDIDIELFGFAVSFYYSREDKYAG